MRHAPAHPPTRPRLRRPSLHLSAAALLSAITGWFMFQSLQAAALGAARYGSPMPVLVARQKLQPGDLITEQSITRRQYPAVAVPPGAASDLIVGRRARRAVSTGEVIVAADAAAPGASAAAAALPPGRVAIALPAGDHPLRLQLGDHVDLLAGTETDFEQVSDDAIVVDVTADTITVGVTSESVSSVASASMLGSVIPVIRSEE